MYCIIHPSDVHFISSTYFSEDLFIVRNITSFEIKKKTDCGSHIISICSTKTGRERLAGRTEESNLNIMLFLEKLCILKDTLENTFGVIL